jgi:hypothetical protein
VSDDEPLGDPTGVGEGGAVGEGSGTSNPLFAPHPTTTPNAHAAQTIRTRRVEELIVVAWATHEVGWLFPTTMKIRETSVNRRERHHRILLPMPVVVRA